MAYKALDIYKDLPKKAGCNDCGKPGCFAFATAVHLEGLPLDKCIHLEPDQLALMKQKAASSQAKGEGPREEPEEQAAKALQQTFSEADFQRLADRSLAELKGEALEVDFFRRRFRLDRDDVVALDGGDVDVWIKVVLLMYVTRATGMPIADQWIAYRDLPNTISKQKTYEEWVDRLAQHFCGRFDELEKVASKLGGEKVSHESAELAFRFQALPRVPLLLLLWDKDDDFEGRGSLLLDKNVLDYQDQEALTFVSEALMRWLLDQEKNS